MEVSYYVAIIRIVTSPLWQERFSVLPLRIRVRLFSFCRFWTHIATSNARSNTVCCSLCWFLQLSFSLRLRGDQKIHPFQYLMVGAALCLFYLLLLSDFRICWVSAGVPDRGVASIGLIRVLPIFPGGGARTLND